MTAPERCPRCDRAECEAARWPVAVYYRERDICNARAAEITKRADDGYPTACTVNPSIAPSEQGVRCPRCDRSYGGNPGQCGTAARRDEWHAAVTLAEANARHTAMRHDEADCLAHAVDWRTRCLAAEQRTWCDGVADSIKVAEGYLAVARALNCKLEYTLEDVLAHLRKMLDWRT
jgi:hypothetical protein